MSRRVVLSNLPHWRSPMHKTALAQAPRHQCLVRPKTDCYVRLHRGANGERPIAIAQSERRPGWSPLNHEEFRVLSASLRSGAGSEAVALRHPVMPIANGLGRGFVGIDGSQLR